MQLETMSVAAERVGQDDVGASVDELLVQGTNLVGVIDVPEFRWIARTEAALEVVGASRTIGEQRATGGQQFGK
jgi:hypothetical protein